MQGPIASVAENWSKVSACADNVGHGYLHKVKHDILRHDSCSSAHDDIDEQNPQELLPQDSSSTCLLWNLATRREARLLVSLKVSKPIDSCSNGQSQEETICYRR